MPMPAAIHTMPHESRADMIRARLAETFAEAAFFYGRALDRAGVARPSIR